MVKLLRYEYQHGDYRYANHLCILLSIWKYFSCMYQAV